MVAAKLMLTALCGGSLLGALAGLTIDPRLKPAPEPPWRHPGKAVFVPTPAYSLVEAGPEDLSPLLPPPGYGAILARRLADRPRAARHDASARPAAERSEAASDQPLAAEDTAQAGLDAMADRAEAAGVVDVPAAIQPVETPAAPPELRIDL